ncbi:Bacitracin transport ATP-binding protein BcrA [[Clostridium] ultunense Esp]|uniref:Bacitracin transport ATP-binding protein BcrA n=1 Tax=[Clostridium] ultunense Esp TaxID=1288971 RepID=M1ZB92_9FIRM|nr:ABC transporter ATP-binding protein [Schnuerera ultunensis]CCQ95043.1 Bacitracin transport ATP-binding protein BcrA [[Clostridium] ultunense Esp]SHD77914.1 Bacitracin transport ATP-binding protein BcrA [[Clostridium] ultunense Esp]
MDELIIETKGLTKDFGKLAAVKDVNLKVRKGALYGFLGPNGAGKSTTIRMLLDLMKPTKGKVYLFNKDIGSHRMEILRKVGAMVESPSYYENLTAYENLEIIRKILQIDKKEIDKALEIVNLFKWKNKRVKNFSLGMKQRLGIAQALMGNRELLILDEPTNGLDPAGVREIRNLIISLPEITGATVLISSHILSEIELIADHVGIIHRGNLLFQGTIEELKAKGNLEIAIRAQPLLEAEKFLKRKGYVVENREGKLYISKGKINIEELNKTLVLEGYGVSHLSENKKNLEEVFLELTGGIE